MVVLEGTARAGVPAAVVVVEPTPAKPLAPDDDQIEARGSTDQSNGSTDQPNGNMGRPNGNTDEPNGNTGRPRRNTGRPRGKDDRSTGTGDWSTGTADHKAENGDRRAGKGYRSPADGDSFPGNCADRSDPTSDDGPAPTLAVVHAAGNGDDAIVDAARRAGPGVIVITSDRGLAARVRVLGAEARGAGWLWDRLRR